MSLARVFGGTEKTDILTDDQKRVLAGAGKVLTNQIGVGVPVYGGDIVPRANNANIAAAFKAAQPTLLGTNNTLQGAVQSALSGQGVDPTAAFQAQLAPARNAFDDTLRALEARYGDAYGKTGALPRMAALANARFGADQSNVLGQMVFNDRQAALNRQAQSIVPALAVDQNKARNLQTLLNIGNTQRTYDIQRGAEGFQKFQAGQAYNNPWLQLIGPVLGTQAKGQQQQAGWLNGSLKALGSLAMVAAA